MATAEELVRRAERVAAELLADAEQRAEREAEAFAAGYRAGYETGWEIGHEHAHYEMTQAWRRLAEYVRDFARVPPFAELETRRWSGGRREDHGRVRPGDFLGVGRGRAGRGAA